MVAEQEADLPSSLVQHQQQVAGLLGALLRCVDPEQVEAATSVLSQIAKASSSNATTSRRVAGSPLASS